MAQPRRAPSEDALLKLPKKSYKKSTRPSSEDEWITLIRRERERRLDLRKKHELTWTLNLAYYMGFQNLLYDRSSGLLRIQNGSSQPLTVNRIGSFIEARHAKITKNRPIARVLPNSTDPIDERAAKYSDQALVHLWRKIGMDAQYDRQNIMTLIFGNAFMTSLWDPWAGDTIVDIKKAVETDELFLSEDGSLEEEEVREGEISSRATSPFAILPADELIPDVKDQPSMMQDFDTTICEAESKYPHLEGLLKAQDKNTMYTQYEKMCARMGTQVFGSSAADLPGAQDKVNASIRGTIYYEKPNYEFEKGVVAVLIGDRLASIGDFPNDYGDNVYPQVKFCEKENGIHFWNQATLERQIPIQRSYNRLRQAIDKNASLMAKGKWMVPKGAQLQQDALDDDSGEIVEYNSAVPEPHQAQIAPLPNYIVDHQTQLVTDFRDCGGQRETTMAPGNQITASVAMQTQAELTDEIIGPILNLRARGMMLVSNTQLCLMDQEWLEKRRIKIFGEGGAVGVQWMASADFRHHTDVHIEVESMYPDLRGAKRQTLIDMWDRRIISDPNDFLRAFRFGNFDMLLEKTEKHEEAVILDIQAIKTGKQPQIFPFQNHMLYVKKLTDFSQTPEFMRMEPDRKALIMQNVQLHAQFIMMQAQPATPQTNQNSVNTPSGSQVTVGSTEGSGA